MVHLLREGGDWKRSRSNTLEFKESKVLLVGSTFGLQGGPCSGSSGVGPSGPQQTVGCV